MFACCHFGSSIDACGKKRHRSQIAASANYKSGRHIASSMGKRAGQALHSKRPAAKMCSQPRSSFTVASSLSAAPACGQDTERTTTVPGYASDFDAQGLASGGNALGAAVAELSTLNRDELRARATMLGVHKY
jgi:hypothetical protein